MMAYYKPLWIKNYKCPELAQHHYFAKLQFLSISELLHFTPNGSTTLPTRKNVRLSKLYHFGIYNFCKKVVRI
jgi:hypothetical protein